MRFVALHVMYNMLQTGLSSGSKVMVLGKKYDPTQEQAYKDITNLGRGGVVSIVEVAPTVTMGPNSNTIVDTPTGAGPF